MQVPAPLPYAQATSVEHARRLLAQHGPETRVVADGRGRILMPTERRWPTSQRRTLRTDMAPR